MTRRAEKSARHFFVTIFYRYNGNILLQNYEQSVNKLKEKIFKNLLTNCR
jgi:hypothetical protein